MCELPRKMFCRKKGNTSEIYTKTESNPHSKRSVKIKHSLRNTNDEVYPVCQVFFLSCLGYKKTNNAIMQRINKFNEEVVAEVRGKFRSMSP